MKHVTIVNGVVDAVYVCLPSEGVETIEAPNDVFTGWLYDGASFAAPVESDLTLEDLCTEAKARVDAAAEAYRLTYITAGIGQAMAYTQKLDEARAYLADTNLTAAECPHIFAEVGITGETAGAVAQVVVDMHAAWQIKSASIEHKRLAAKAAIDAAETAEEINAAAQVDWG